jgi:DNA-binding IclR family transcriptional regulator
VRSIAVPIEDQAGRPVAAITISSRAERMTRAEMVEAFPPAPKRNQQWARERLG